MSQFRDEQSSALNASRSEQKIAILGGGYAGLAAAIELNRLGYGDNVTLFDARLRHQKITQWHKLARGRQAHHYEVAFSHLAERFNFRFVHKAIDMKRVIADPVAELGGQFGAIILAQGSHTPAKPPGVITLDQLRDEQLVTSSICLRLETREVETKGLFGLYQRLKTGQERLEGRVAALESSEPA